MPRYEYQCDSCGRVSEDIRSVDERQDPMRCGDDRCEGTMFLIPSRASIAFKGKGWTPKGRGRSR